MAEFEKLTNAQEQDFPDASEAWKKKEPTSFKEIVLRSIELCRVEWSKDVREGGTYMVKTQKGSIPLYFPDQADICKNSTETLYDLMFYYFDETIKEKIKPIEEALSKTNKFQTEIYNNVLKAYTGEGRTDKARKDAERRTIAYVLEHYRKMWRELILLFKRKNEFSTKRKIGLE